MATDNRPDVDYPSSNNLRVAGDINVDKIEVISLANGRRFPVTNQVVSIQIFEDMFSPFITGSLIFKDSLDLINQMPFVGQEYVDIKMFTPSLDIGLKDQGIIQGRFYIYKMTDREYVAEKSVMYELHFISCEAVTDMNIKMSRGFKGKISDIAGKLVKEKYGLDTDKTVTIEETKNNTRYVSNYWSAIQNLNFLLRQAENQSTSATFTFFENRDGFNFVSLDYLNAQEPFHTWKWGNMDQSVDVKPGGGSARNLNNDFAKILELSVPKGFDYIDRIKTGTYASRMIVHDVTTKRYKTVNYDYLKTFYESKEETRLNKFPITTPDVAARVNAMIFPFEVANRLFDEFGDVSNYRVTQDRISRLKQAESFSVKLRVKGRTDYTVGRKVYLSVVTPQPTKETDTPEATKDKMYSGYYLISAINHVIDKTTHECYVELIKDTLEIDLEKS